MKRILFKIALLLSLGLPAVTGGCTYTGTLDKSFYKPAARDHMDGGKIPMSIAVVNSGGANIASVLHALRRL